MRGATGSGSQRLYSFRDILILKVIKRLLDAGISLQQIRTAVSHLRERGTDDLTRVTLMSDGASVYECTSNDEVIDLLQGGQGVFGIAIGGVWREIEGTLAELPSERTARTRSRRPATSSPPAAPPARPADRARRRWSSTRHSLTIPHGRVFGSGQADRPERRRGNSSPEPLRRQDRAGQATLKPHRGATEGEGPSLASPGSPAVSDQLCLRRPPHRSAPRRHRADARGRSGHESLEALMSAAVPGGIRTRGVARPARGGDRGGRGRRAARARRRATGWPSR